MPSFPRSRWARGVLSSVGCGTAMGSCRSCGAWRLILRTLCNENVGRHGFSNENVPTLLAGEHVFDRFEIVREIGPGDLTVLYEARDPFVRNRPVVLKILRRPERL